MYCGKAGLQFVSLRYLPTFNVLAIHVRLMSCMYSCTYLHFPVHCKANIPNLTIRDFKPENQNKMTTPFPPSLSPPSLTSVTLGKVFDQVYPRVLAVSTVSNCSHNSLRKLIFQTTSHNQYNSCVSHELNTLGSAPPLLGMYYVRNELYCSRLSPSLPPSLTLLLPPPLLHVRSFNMFI